MLTNIPSIPAIGFVLIKSKKPYQRRIKSYVISHIMYLRVNVAYDSNERAKKRTNHYTYACTYVSYESSEIR